MKIEWSPLALADRNNIFDYIESESPSAAITVDDRIAEQVEDLANFPEIGRPGRIEETRELVVSRTPYIVAYRLVDNMVVILRILHGAQQWPDIY